MVLLGVLGGRFGMPYPSLFVLGGLVLGALVSPTDDVAVIALAQTLRIPRRVMTIVSAEGLFNDVTSLVAYGFAVTAVTTGVFFLGAAVLSLAVLGLGAVALGLA